MHNTSDISSLYREFGGDPRNYREIGQESRAAAACGRWPLLGRIRPGALAVPPAVGGRSDPPVRAAPWPPAAVATLALPPAPGYPPVRAGAAVDGERMLALVRGARVQRIALDALALPAAAPEAAKPQAPVAAPEAAKPQAPVAAPEAAKPPAPVATPASLAGEAAVQTAPRLEPSLAPAAPPADAPPPPFAAAAVQALPPAAPVAAPTAMPLAEPAALPTAEPAPPAEVAAEPAPAFLPAAEPAPAAAAAAATPLQSVFARLAKAPGAGQPPPSSSTAKE